MIRRSLLGILLGLTLLIAAFASMGFTYTHHRNWVMGDGTVLKHYIRANSWWTLMPGAKTETIRLSFGM